MIKFEQDIMIGMAGKFTTFASYFFLGALGAFVLYISIPRNSLSVAVQPRGSTVKIKSAGLAKGGFIQISIHPQELVNPSVELGVSEYLPAGRYRDLNVILDKEEAFGSFSKIVATMYLDNGDGSFDQQSDRRVISKTAGIH